MHASEKRIIMVPSEKREFEFNPLSSATENTEREKFLSTFRSCPIPENELLVNLSLFMRRQVLSRMFFMQELYLNIINVHGIIVEFGVRWGRNLALFTSFRGMYEPYNYNRKIVGFDTFSGFPSVSQKDGNFAGIKPDAFSVTPSYEEYLAQVLDYHEAECPVNHIKKYELVKGNVLETLPRYLEQHPETIIALAYFDFDLYEPTKVCLQLIQKHLTKGSVIGFDELNYATFPGETLALREVLGLDRYAIRHSPHNPLPGYLVIE